MLTIENLPRVLSVTGAALSGVANFKQYWAQAQMDTNSIDPENAPSDKYVGGCTSVWMCFVLRSGNQENVQLKFP